MIETLNGFLDNLYFSLIFVYTTNTILVFYVSKYIIKLYDTDRTSHMNLLFSLIFTITYLTPQYFHHAAYYLLEISFHGQHTFYSLYKYLFYFHDPLSMLMLFFLVRLFLKPNKYRMILMLRQIYLIYEAIFLLYLLTESILKLRIPDLGVYTGFCISAFIIAAFLLPPCILLWKSTHRFSVLMNQPFFPFGFRHKNTAAYCIHFIIIWFISASARYVCLHSKTTDKILQLFILFLLIILLLLNDYYKAKNKLLQLKTQHHKEHIGNLLESIEDFKGIKHDFYKILQIYETYITSKNYDHLLTYHHKLFKDITSSGSRLELAANFDAAPVLYGILLQKLNYAKNNDVILSIRQSADPLKLPINDYDLSRILSNLIDNAIEAAALSQSKKAAVSLESRKNNYVIVITNTIDTPPDQNLIFEKGYTRKDGHSGIGLNEVKKILSCYTACSIYPSIQPGMFSIIFEMGADA